MRKKKIKEHLQEQTIKNVEELKKMGIHYVSNKEYNEKPTKYDYALGTIPSKQNKLFGSSIIKKISQIF